jgi:hypothetical protein
MDSTEQHENSSMSQSMNFLLAFL